MSLTPNEIRQVLSILANSEWDEAVVTVGDVTIAVARNGATLPRIDGPSSSAAHTPAPTATAAAQVPPVVDPAPASAPASSPAAVATSASSPQGGTEVCAPSVGVFWRAPEPGAAPFVEVGQRVEAGQDMCIVEVMKLMNRVPAPCAGVVTALHIGNGDAVEFGTVLFTIDPE